MLTIVLQLPEALSTVMCCAGLYPGSKSLIGCTTEPEGVVSSVSSVRTATQ